MSGQHSVLVYRGVMIACTSDSFTRESHMTAKSFVEYTYSFLSTAAARVLYRLQFRLRVGG